MVSPKFLVLALTLVAPAFLLSQTGTSSVRGTVTDPAGRVIQDATVTLTNMETNAVRTTKSTDSGTYVFDLITPAKYRLEFDAVGFKKSVLENVEALIGKRPYEEKRLLDVEDHTREGLAPGDSNGVPPAVVVPPTAEEVK